VIIKVAHLKRLHRMLRVLDTCERQFQDKHGDARPGSIRASRKIDAEALRRVLADIDDHFAQPPEHEPGVMPAGKPAFVVKIESNYNGGGRLLRWVDYGIVAKLKGVPTGNFDGNELHYGTFACFPVHDGGALRPEPPPSRDVREDESVPRPAWPFPVSAHTERTAPTRRRENP
jgi:hypothetical protein